MKKVIAICFVLILVSSFFANAQVDFEALPGNEEAQEILDIVPNDTKELMERFEIDEISPESLLSLSFSDFLKFLWESFKNHATSPIKHAFLIVAITVMCAILEAIKSSVKSETLNKAFSIVATLGVVATISDGATECISKTCETINGYNNFMIGYIPIYSAAVAASGNVATSGAYASFMFMVCQIISSLVTNVVVPLMGSYLALSVVSGINPSLNLGGLTQGIRKVAIWIITFMMTLFVAVMSFQTVISVGKDNLTVRTGKYLLGSFVPIVGSALSEVYLSVQACMKLLKNSIGGYAIVATVITFIPILLMLVVWKGAIFVSQVFSEILDIKSISSLTKSVGSVFSILIALVLVFLLLIVFSTTLIILIAGGA